MDSLSDFDAVDAEMCQVMQSQVNTSVRHNYEIQNVKFIVWLYDQGEHYIEILVCVTVDIRLSSVSIL